MRKKLYLLFMTPMLMSIVCCNQNKQSTQNENDKEIVNVTDSSAADESGHYMEFMTLSNEDLWLRFKPSLEQSDIIKRLVDAYNASVVQNSIMTDFDLQMRGYNLNDVIKAIKRIDVTHIKDAEVLEKLKAYKKEMLYLLSVDPDSVNQNVHNPWKAKDELYAYLSKKYHVSTFGKLNEELYWKEYNQCSSVPEWNELREKRGNDKMVDELKKKYSNAKDFDARCIYAIELGHAYEADLDSWESADGFSQNPAIPIMEALMKENKYSLYLNELWQKWRVLYQSARGASKDSEIPNWIYNDYRNTCCCTILSYINEHPRDIKAINEFLVMACKENILRHGGFEYGNQYAVEKYYLFPELYKEDEDKQE